MSLLRSKNFGLFVPVFLSCVLLVGCSSEVPPESAENTSNLDSEPGISIEASAPPENVMPSLNLSTQQEIVDFLVNAGLGSDALANCQAVSTLPFFNYVYAIDMPFGQAKEINFVMNPDKSDGSGSDTEYLETFNSQDETTLCASFNPGLVTDNQLNIFVVTEGKFLELGLL